mmetsp:Transcript_32161/g.67404  ORF Transcript_32161/g.67404 Transcript_32161/m.67404 type:complete len:205 (+) Transcript_32161:77-691(+)
MTAMMMMIYLRRMMPATTMRILNPRQPRRMTAMTMMITMTMISYSQPKRERLPHLSNNQPLLSKRPLPSKERPLSKRYHHHHHHPTRPNHPNITRHPPNSPLGYPSSKTTNRSPSHPPSPNYRTTIPTSPSTPSSPTASKDSPSSSREYSPPMPDPPRVPTPRYRSPVPIEGITSPLDVSIAPTTRANSRGRRRRTRSSAWGGG